VALASATEKSKPKFVVRDHSGQALAYVYFEDEPGRRSEAKLVSKDEAGRALIEYWHTKTTSRLDRARFHQA